MSPAEYSSLTSKITAPQNMFYKYICEQVVFPGWCIVGGFEETSKHYQYLLTVDNKSNLKYKKILAKTSLKNAKLHLTEAKLVQLLEAKGIGRPSTFSSLVEKIQERKYVKRMNISGKKIECIDFQLIKNELLEIHEEKEFGNEKNKLVIQPVGILVVEFLYEYFNSLFDYDYTKQMEDELDKIAQGSGSKSSICTKCHSEIESLSKNTKKRERGIRIDQEHEYIIGKYGPIIKYTDKISKEVSFKKVKTSIDVNKLQQGKYTLDEILDDGSDKKGVLLGKYDNTDLFLKRGQYGMYVEWGKSRRSISAMKLEEADINLENVSTFLAKGNGVLRTIDDTISIRKGKYGDYIFYKKPTWKKPRFIGLSGFEGNIMECCKQEIIDWISEKK